MTAVSLKEISQVLRRVPLFGDLEDAEIDRLAGSFRRQELPAQSLIFKDGDAADAFYIIVNGAVAVFRDQVGKPLQLQARLGGDEFLGEVGLFDDHRRSSSARTTAATTLLGIRKQDLLAFVDDYPGVAIKLQIAAARRHSDNVAAALDLGMRREVRIRLERPVVVEVAAGDSYPATLDNLSFGGMCLRRVATDWSQGEELDMTVRDTGVELPVSARVSWREGDAMGLTFVGHDDEHDSRVQTMLRHMLSADVAAHDG